MAFLDETGLTRLWNKISSNFVDISTNQTIGGEKTFNGWVILNSSNGGDNRICTSSTANSISILGGGKSVNDGGYLVIYGKTHTNAGQFKIVAGDDTNKPALIGKPNGTLTWNGKGFVYDSGDQDVGGVKTFTTTIFKKRSSSTSNNDIYYTESDNSGTVLLRLNSNSDATPRFQMSVKAISATQAYSGPQVWLRRDGNITIRTTNTSGDSTKDLVLNNSGTATWNGQTIQTSSDERLKTAFSSVPDAILDAWGTIAWQRFKYRDAVAKKGEENCRWHTGLVAQHVKRTFEDQGQDALAYGILCHDEWQDEYETDDDGKKVLIRSAGDTWTVRYAEALCIEAAYQRRRAERAEARITSLEERLLALEAKIQ